LYFITPDYASNELFIAIKEIHTTTNATITAASTTTTTSTTPTNGELQT
jgi:hypothetical protein